MLSGAEFGEDVQVQADGLKSNQPPQPDGSPRSSAGAGLKAANKHTDFCIKTSCCSKELEALPVILRKALGSVQTVMDRKMWGSCSWQFDRKDN